MKQFFHRFRLNNEIFEKLADKFSLAAVEN